MKRILFFTLLSGLITASFSLNASESETETGTVHQCYDFKQKPHPEEFFIEKCSIEEFLPELQIYNPDLVILEIPKLLDEKTRTLVTKYMMQKKTAQCKKN